LYEIAQVGARPATWSTCLWVRHAARNAVLQWERQVLPIDAL